MAQFHKDFDRITRGTYEWHAFTSQSWWVSMSRNLVSYVPMGDVDRRRLATVSGLSSPDTTSGLSGSCKVSRYRIHYTRRLPMHWKHAIDAALLCKAETDGQLPCIDRWPMQAQGQIGSITVFTIQCLPGSGKPWKDFQDKRQCWIPLHKLPTPPTFVTFADEL